MQAPLGLMAFCSCASLHPVSLCKLSSLVSSRARSHSPASPRGTKVLSLHSLTCKFLLPRQLRPPQVTWVSARACPLTRVMRYQSVCLSIKKWQYSLELPWQFFTIRFKFPRHSLPLKSALLRAQDAHFPGRHGTAVLTSRAGTKSKIVSQAGTVQPCSLPGQVYRAR